MDEKYELLLHHGEKVARIGNVDPDCYSHLDLLADVSESLLNDVPSSVAQSFTVVHYPPRSVDKIVIASDTDVLRMFTYYSGRTKEISLYVDVEKNIDHGIGSSIGRVDKMNESDGIKGLAVVPEQWVDDEDWGRSAFFYESDDMDLNCEVEGRANSVVVHGGILDNDYMLSDFHSDDTGGSLSSGEENRHARTMEGLLKDKVFDSKGKKIQFEVGMLFPNIHIFRDALKDFVVQEGFELVRDKNERTRITAHCGGQGCKWRVHASLLPDDITFKIKTYTAEHTCIKTRKITEANSTWIAKKLGKRFRENPEMSLSAMRAALKEKYGIEAGRMQLYRAKQKAIEEIEGNHGTSYTKLPLYAAELRRSNPGTLVKIELERDSLENSPTFKRMFICFEAMKVGFLNGCRPFVGLDGCHLKGPYGGVLLCAVGLDGNDGIFPLAFAIVESETKQSWSFFCSYLYDCIGHRPNNRPWTFMSDGQKGISLAIAEYFPGANHRRCCRHLFNNFKAQHGAVQLRSLFWGAARASFEVEFRKYMSEIKIVSTDAHKWLMDVPLHTWTRHKFDHNVKNDHITNNMTESFNNWVGELRQKPVLTLVDSIRTKLMKMLQKRHEEGLAWSTSVTKNTMKKIEKLKDKARHCHILYAGGDEFEVNDGITRFVVFIDRRTCSCGVWDISGLPCKHAIACLLYKRLNVENYCDEYFTKAKYLATYNGMIHPLLDESMWPEAMGDPIVPPRLRRLPGRPKKNRRKEQGETSGSSVQRKLHTISCSNCKEMGHNKRKCQRAPVARGTSRGSGRPRGSGRAKGTNQGTMSHGRGSSQVAENAPIGSTQASRTSTG